MDRRSPDGGWVCVGCVPVLLVTAWVVPGHQLQEGANGTPLRIRVNLGKDIPNTVLVCAVVNPTHRMPTGTGSRKCESCMVGIMAFPFVSDRSDTLLRWEGRVGKFRVSDR